jgi:acetylornithine/succinyldiaminopimelate/putrescine aminotransferase
VIIEENLVASSAGKSALFKKELNHPLIAEARGEGLFLAVRLTDPNYVQYAITHAPDFGLILDYFLFCNNAFRIAPPLIISNDEILWACGQLKKLLDDVIKKAGK